MSTSCEKMIGSCANTCQQVVREYPKNIHRIKRHITQLSLFANLKDQLLDLWTHVSST
jgi:hypothetical protein